HLNLARTSGMVPSDHRPAGSFGFDELEGEYFFFRYHGSTALDESLSAESISAMPYRVISFIDVLDQKVSPEEIRGKTVLVGTMIKENPGDFSKTPFSKSQYIHPNLAIHATILDSI